MKMLASGGQPNAVFGSGSGRYDTFPTESKVDEDIGKRGSVECRVWFGYRCYDASRLNMKSMKILASGGQLNAMFGSGTSVTMLLDRI